MNRKFVFFLQTMALVIAFGSLVLLVAHVEFCSRYDAPLNFYVIGMMAPIFIASFIICMKLDPVWEESDD